MPRPAPARPSGNRRDAGTAAAQRSPAAAVPEVPGAHASDPRPWGRVADDGTVFVTTADGERPVGSYPGATAEEALAYFGRKYDELVAQVSLAEQRLTVPDVPVKDVSRALDNVRGTLPEAAVVGDLAGLQARIDSVDSVLAERRKVADAARRAAKEEARAQRTALVEEAEAIAGTDASRVQWKAAGERMGVLFEAWKTAQRGGPRLDKPVEDDLWKRFSHARTAFDRARRHHFAQLSTQHAEAKAAKERLVAEAEALSTSTAWAETASAYRALMDRWKTAGRASRKEDDVLWARFRSAQDVFFSARNADAATQDAEFDGNLRQKEALLVEAEALLPVRDLATAKSALRSLQERWEEIGKVPRADVSRLERRMRTVEEAVKARDDDRWKRSNPEGKARAEGALGQLEDSIAALERDLATATERGDRRRIREAEEALVARRAWLEQVRRAAQDFA